MSTNVGMSLHSISGKDFGGCRRLTQLLRLLMFQQPAGMNPPSSKLATQRPLLPSDENTIKDTVNTHYILSQWFPFYLINYPC